VRAGVRAVPVREPGGGLLPTLRSLVAAAERCRDEGSPVRALLLCNPGNPTGLVLPSALLRELLAWALGSGLHCIVDEIYAFSCWSPEVGPRFVSAAELAWGAGGAGLPGAAERLHIVAGMSKDFCCSGLRVGVLYSKCGPLHAALVRGPAVESRESFWLSHASHLQDNISYFSSVSTHTQRALSNVLADTMWLDSFLAERRERLARAHGALAASLRNVGLPFTDSGAGMFVWIDCRKLLPRAADGGAPGWQEETDLWTAFYSCEGGRGGVLLTPGADCAAAEPGWFRACFAAADPACLPLVGGRLRAVAAALGGASPSEYCYQQ